MIRIDGPDGPADPCPPGLDHDTLRAAITRAASTTTLTVARPDGTPLVLRWGAQLDLRAVRPTAVHQIEHEHGEMTDAAGYIARYATTGTGAHAGTDRPSATSTTSSTSTSAPTTAS